MTLKRIAMLLMTVSSTAIVSAQSVLNLSGSSYYQTFNSVGAGLPAGWEIDSIATATAKGSPLIFNTTATAWKQPSTTNGKGLNFAAKNGFTDPGTSTAQQAAATNRAMGLRQVANIDSQVAFTLIIAQTSGLTNFNLSFLLQSLDTSSPRITTWEVQYGIGSNPASFTTVPATGTLTTGGQGNFSSNLIVASFGSALNSQSGPVIIRIAALHKSSGVSGRASTAIDSLTLFWTGTAFNNQPQVIALSPANGATGVPAASTLSITFDKTITAGPGSIYIKDATMQTTITKTATSPDVTISGMTATIANAGLTAGHLYRISFDSTAFKNGIYASAGIYDSTSWMFTVQPPVVTLPAIMEYFDAACAGGGLPAGWSRQDVQGPGQQWSCYMPTGSANAAMQINGYAGSTYNVNEDWLITPRIDLSGSMTGGLGFKLWKRFSGDELHVLYSTDYDGMSSPSTATWTDLNLAMSPSDTAFYKSFISPLPARILFVAFRYTSTSGAAYQMRLDSVYVGGTTGITIQSSAGSSMPVSVVGTPECSHLVLAFEAAASGPVAAAIYDLAGRVVYRTQVVAVKGSNRTTLRPEGLQAGMYVIRLWGGAAGQGIARTFIR